MKSSNITFGNVYGWLVALGMPGDEAQRICHGSLWHGVRMVNKMKAWDRKKVVDKRQLLWQK